MKLHRHDSLVSREAWDSKAYDIIGNESFWLLSGFASRWAPRPAPFIFLIDFIGVKSLLPNIGDKLSAWVNNLGRISSNTPER